MLILQMQRNQYKTFTMKKLFAMALVAVMALFGANRAAADQWISPEEVPATLKTFVTQNFGKDVTIVKASKDRKAGAFEYDVTLSNGVEIDYGVDQQWTEIDGEDAGVDIPAAIVGETIVSDINVRYPGAKVRKIERKYRGYEVTLNNGRELKYDKNGKLTRDKRDD